MAFIEILNHTPLKDILLKETQKKVAFHSFKIPTLEKMDGHWSPFLFFREHIFGGFYPSFSLFGNLGLES